MSWHHQRTILEGMDRDAAEQEVVAAWREECAAIHEDNAKREAKKRPKKKLPPPPKRPPWGSKPTPPPSEDKAREAKPAPVGRLAPAEGYDPDGPDADLMAPQQGALFGDPRNGRLQVKAAEYTGYVPTSDDEIREALARDARKAIEARNKVRRPANPAPAATQPPPAASPARAPEPPVPMPKPPPPGLT